MPFRHIETPAFADQLCKNLFIFFVFRVIFFHFHLLINFYEAAVYNNVSLIMDLPQFPLGVLVLMGMQ